MGLVEAAYALGELHYKTLKDYSNALKWFEIAHNENNDNKAAYALGLLYDTKLKDYENAKKWYEIAHNENGDKDASNSLGLLYKDMLKDYDKALKWFQISYDKNKHYGSLYWIAVMHRDGLGVKKDLVKARSLFQKVANKTKPNGELNKLAKQALLALDANKPK
jgi:TPR repeat protein